MNGIWSRLLALHWKYTEHLAMHTSVFCNWKKLCKVVSFYGRPVVAKVKLLTKFVCRPSLFCQNVDWRPVFMQELNTVYDMFRTRSLLHSNVYQHRLVKVYDTMRVVFTVYIAFGFPPYGCEYRSQQKSVAGAGRHGHSRSNYVVIAVAYLPLGCICFVRLVAVRAGSKLWTSV